MILNEIKQILEKEEFACTDIPANEQFPFGQLLVFLGLDSKKRERILEITAIQQQIAPEFNLPHASSLPFRIQFRIALPFKIQDIALTQVASLILFLNQFIDLPGFEFNELEGQVTYRYVWIVQPSLIDSTLIMSILGALMLNLGLFSETIESLADGKISFNDLLAQIIKMGDHPFRPTKTGS